MNERNEKRRSFLFFDDHEDNTPTSSVQSPLKTEQAPLRKNINFWKTGIQKYKIKLVGTMQLNSMNTTTTVENNFIFHLKEIHQNGDVLLNLISYNKEMVACNNQGFKEMFLVTRQLEKLYDEFEAVINRDGEIQEIRNVDFLKDKWKKIKNELVNYFDEGTDIESFFRINDQTMDDQSFWRQMMNEQEFFFLFFNLANYGGSFNSNSRIKRDNAFRTNEIDWKIDYRGMAEGNEITVSLDGAFSPERRWLDKAYGKMPFLTGMEFAPNFKIDGEYKFDSKSGFIKEANITLEETVIPTFLSHKLEFNIIQIP